MRFNLLPPLRLVQLVMLGSVLLVVSWCLDFLPVPHSPHGHESLLAAMWRYRSIFLVVGTFVAAVLLIWRAYAALSRGILDDQWNEAQLEDARAWAKSPVLTWYVCLLLAASVAIMVLGHILHFRWSTLVLIYSVYPIGWARKKIAKPTTLTVVDPWKDRKPFFSSHWGEPPSTGPSTTSA